MAEDTAPPAPPPFVGPLADKDRIFTNLYNDNSQFLGRRSGGTGTAPRI